MNDKMLQEMDWRVRVFDSLSFPTLIMRPDKSILTANQVFIEQRGLQVDQIIGKKCHEIFYGEKMCPNEVCPLKKVIKGKRGQSILRRTHSLTGKQIWEDRVFSPILDEHGNVDYIMESVRDVTRLKNLEITLKEAEAFLEKIIYSSPVAIVAADAYANILLMNPAAEDLFGYTQRQAITRISVENLYPAGTAKGIMKQLRSGKQGGKGKLPSTNTVILNANGQEIPVELNASIIYEDDSEVATVGIYKDLRPLLAMEEKLQEANTQLVQSEKLASMGKLAAGVAHEINNPLGIILGYSQLLLKLAPEHQDDLKIIEKHVKNCKTVVSDLLSFSRKGSSEMSIVDINEVVDGVVKFLSNHSDFRNIEMSLNPYTGDRLNILGNEQELAQVMVNLVINACHAVDGKGKIEITTQKTKSNKILIMVGDNGKGIEKKNLSRIFDPFFTTKPVGQGTGLGLSVGYGIIKRHQGDIQVKSSKEKGTLFTISLPADRMMT